MALSRNPQGPLRNADLVQVGDDADGVIFFDRTLPPPVLPDSGDPSYLVEMADRHDLLAYRKMGNSQYGWVIMLRNADLDPEEVDMRLWPNDFVPGRSIKIPVRTSLENRGII
jgi:hypothetical protein